MFSLNKIVWLSLPLLLGVLIQGCASNQSKIVEDAVGADRDGSFGKYNSGVGTLAVTSDRRMVVVNLKNSEFCAEPEPITANNFTSKLESLLTATVKDDIEARAEFMKEYSSVISQLFKPSQGLRFVQVLQYSLCQAARNSDINSNDFKVTFNKILTESKEIIIAENNISIVEQKLVSSKMENSKQKDIIIKFKAESIAHTASIKKLNDANGKLQKEVTSLIVTKALYEKDIFYLKKMLDSNTSK